jgi:AmiR/NasT family two-component response regulator
VLGEADSKARQSLEEMLAGLGFRVTSAETEGQLVEAARVVQPDLAVIATALPDTDGFEAAAALNRERETPVILVARMHEPEDLKRLAGGHIMAYLVMPVGRSPLEAAIPIALARFQQYLLVMKETADLRRALKELGPNPP